MVIQVDIKGGYTTEIYNSGYVFKKNGKVILKIDYDAGMIERFSPLVKTTVIADYSFQEKDAKINRLMVENLRLNAELDEAISDRLDADRKLTKAYRRNLIERILNKRV
jgi:hypothetical protein